MKTLLAFIFIGLNAYAADPCTDKGGTILTGNLENESVRICAFNESGIGSAVGYNDIALNAGGEPTLAVRTFLKKTEIDPPGWGPQEVCSNQKASVIKIVFKKEAYSFCKFSDGSLIDGVSLSHGILVTQELKAALEK